MLKRVAQLCFRRRGRVVLAWIAGIVVIGAVIGAVGPGYRSDFTLPEVESKRGIDLLDAQSAGRAAARSATSCSRLPAGWTTRP
jgi:putative drug exporter of the RND superfamily